MRTYIVVCLLFCFFKLPLCGQGSNDDHINYIRKVFKETNQICETISPAYYRSDTLDPKGPVEFREWEYNNDVIRFQLTEYRGEDKQVSDFYFSEGGLIFAFTRDFLRDEFGTPYVRENRYYFKDEDTMIRWLDEDKKEVNPNSSVFYQRGAGIWSAMNWSGEAFFMLGGSEKKVSNFKDDLTIHSDSFNGIALGRPVSDFFGQLKKGMLETGEGNFKVYYIQSSSGEELGYLLEDEKDQSIEAIVVTSSLGSTQKGIMVGFTYEQLQGAFPEVKMVRSEIEGRLSASSGNFTFFFDGYEVNYPGKINAIIIGR
ncbi:MAG: hypothetical protein AAGG59_13695 [Bacteroidota bacterium]